MAGETESEGLSIAQLMEIMEDLKRQNASGTGRGGSPAVRGNAQRKWGSQTSTGGIHEEPISAVERGDATKLTILEG